MASSTMAGADAIHRRSCGRKAALSFWGSLKSGQQLIGTPPMEQRAYFKSQSIFRRLPDMYKELNDLKKQIEELKKK